ncbi:MAG: methylmalonyl-CoA mutase family protein [Rikenellaceae bacterium]|nr:methylmalonyl-CoA mutase family protein [Rikenellaceae bacterium]
MANNKENLFTEFPPVSTEEWEKVINVDLKGADYDKKLVWKTQEGFNVRPYYRAEDLDSVGCLGSEPGEFPYVRGTKPNNNWLVRQTIEVNSPEEANTKALKVLMKGVDSLGFFIVNEDFDSDDLNKLLNGIELSAIEVDFSGRSFYKITEIVLNKIKNDDIDADNVKISINNDPIINKLSLVGNFGCSEDGSKHFHKISNYIKTAAPYKKARLVAVNGHVFNNSGSTIVQELAFSLSAGHDYIVRLMDAGLTIDQAAASIKFNMAVSPNYFMEIAKFRAGRMLWANIVKQYNPEYDCSEKMSVHAITSKWNMTIYDPYVNMLRGTTEAMSAAIAGVNSIEVVPFNAVYEQPTVFSSRIARNTQLLLKEESHFNQVADPSGGSYYIENLTQSIADETWKLFLEIEDRGGYIEAFKSGVIQKYIKESADKKNKNIATRREIILGTNQYPNFQEKEGEKSDILGSFGSKCECTENAPKIETLQPYRGAMPFEELRLAIDKSGKNPKAFMLTVGNLAFCRARAQFSSNFFGCAGIEPIDNVRFATVEEGVKAALESKAGIVVLCSSDDEYAEFAPKAAELLGDKAILVVAGDPACRPELEKAGINKFISVRSNVLETLKEYKQLLGL